MTNFQDYWAAAVAAWPTIWLADLLRYLIVAGGFAAALAWAPTAWRLRRTVRIRQIADGQQLREFGHSMLTVVVFSLVGASVFLGYKAGYLKIYASADQYGWLWLVCSFFVMVVAQDAWFYWTHRLMHHHAVFRWAHRTHHRSLAPTPWTAYSFAPAEALVQAIFLPLFVLLVPVHQTVAFLWMMHMVVRNVAGHAGVELVPRAWLAGWWGRWLTTTLHHEMHHAYANSNYGLYFVWWDRWCGTEHPGYQDGLWALTGKLHQPRVDAAAIQPAPQVGSRTPTVLVALVVAGMGVFAAPEALASNVQGEWVTQGYSARVDIRPCQSAPAKLCGAITWLWEPVDRQGRPVVDAKHPDTSRRGQPLIGLEMLSGFNPGPVDGSWVDGQIYNPEDGRTYNSRMKLRSPDVLEVEGCVLVFCTRQIWRRVPRRCDDESKAVAAIPDRSILISSLQGHPSP
jgi:lathosterol oxidase